MNRSADTEHNKGKYEDIINTEYPFPSGRSRMSMHDRAAQFAPFAALTGLGEELEKVAEVTEGRSR